VNRTYHLEIQAIVDTDFAITALKNNLQAQGKLLNVEGNVPGKLGFNQYWVQTLYKDDISMYYIVYEEYVDTLGKVHNTNNFYAIDVNTADLYVAYKLDEGKYNLIPFNE
jgi:transposase